MEKRLLPVTSRKTTVKVQDKPYEISVCQNAKTVWVAVGECMGERIETRGRSEREAVARWREAARYKSG